MLKRLTLSIMLALLLSLTITGLAAASGPVHFGYEGEIGPGHWAELSPDYATCAAGKEQSPIDVPASAALNPADVTFNYQPTKLNIVNNGHAIQVNYDPGSSIQVQGVQYDLVQFHLHALSEHTLSGRQYDMELHLVHKSADGRLAVVGVLLTHGGENAAFVPVLAHMPATEGEPETISGLTFNARDLLPSDRSYYRYAGSLTTPPCTENVTWIVMHTPVELSQAQVAAFQQLYKDDFRPVQPLGSRQFVLTSALAPKSLPVTGGGLFLGAEELAGLGLLAASVGVYLRRRAGLRRNN